MVRAALSSYWSCELANDICSDKADVYRSNWGKEAFWLGDVADLKDEMAPANADLVWASFPCQDLSLAGKGAGLDADKSGAFWPFWKVVSENSRRPKTIVLENVTGSLTSNRGEDFNSICEALFKAGYRAGCVLLDAVNYLPQSRKRLFWIAVRDDLVVPKKLLLEEPRADLHPRSMRRNVTHAGLGNRNDWLWWNVPVPNKDVIPTLADLVQKESEDVIWHSPEQTHSLLGLMNQTNLDKVLTRKRDHHVNVGTLYRRMRDEGGDKMVQRAEVRFDGIAGCLRTPKGGSSLQTVVFSGKGEIRTRHISPRETARLMGLPDTFVLPAHRTKAYQVTGDGVAVPVVQAVVESIIEPVLSSNPVTPKSKRSRQPRSSVIVEANC